MLRKVARRLPLDAGEMERLHRYVRELRSADPQGFALLCETYGEALEGEYGFSLDGVEAGRGELLAHLLQHPGLVEELAREPQPLEAFPPRLRPYLASEFGGRVTAAQVQDLLAWVRELEKPKELPMARKGDAVLVYEEGNPGKETGLEAHFQRVARLPFVTRLVSVRYLRRGKASADRFEVRGDDCLSGVFTHRDKSIYYLVYLTEADADKAGQACRLLNWLFCDGREGETHGVRET
ncbi:MAG: hypothetical protein QHH05_00840 [Syntrophomonadaceae bacterium]|nr:hypothetical protein [Syntrophomonadaceae bacterium]